MKKQDIQWLSKPEDHDYPAALSYLTLIYKEKHAETIVKDLRAAPVTTFKAKDIFRASGLPLLGISNLHLAKDTDKIKNNVPLSPLLLARPWQTNAPLIIADGYHRLCAVYTFDEDALIPCKIV